MKRVLVITPYYAPDFGPSSPLITTLAEALSANFNVRVTVVCTAPHFPDGMVREGFHHLPWKWSVENGVHVCRIWIPSGERSRLFHRMVVFVIYQLLSTLAASRQKYDVVLITNPAIETGFLFLVFAWLKRKPSIFCVWDIYPEVGVQLGVFKNTLVIRVVKWLENFCLEHASAVQALAQGFLSNLRERVSDPQKVVYIHPWLTMNGLHGLSKQNPFARAHGFDEKFIVMYAGNLGLSQGLDKFIWGAKELSNQQRIHFVFVGDGIAAPDLHSLAQSLELSNVTFLPYQPRERLAEVLSSADISLVSLQSGLTASSLPSKTFSIMACERPVFAMVDEDSELWRMIQSARAGWCVPSSASPKQIADRIKSIYHESATLKVYGANAGRYVRENFSLQKAAGRFHNLIEEVAS
jgi:colanic acid biosynthesis glycosyl transferase WcaI